MPVSFDGTEAKQGGGGMLPPGHYTARVRMVTPFRANSGSKGLECLLEVDGGEHKGETIKDALWLEKDGAPSKALPFTRWAIECTGAALPSGAFEVEADDPACTALCRAMTGGRVAIAVGLEPDRQDPAKEWPRVKQWDRPQGRPTNDMPANAPAGGAPSNDDDIPF